MNACHLEVRNNKAARSATDRLKCRLWVHCTSVSRLMDSDIMRTGRNYPSACCKFLPVRIRENSLLLVEEDSRIANLMNSTENWNHWYGEILQPLNKLKRMQLVHLYPFFSLASGDLNGHAMCRFDVTLIESIISSNDTQCSLLKDENSSPLPFISRLGIFYLAQTRPRIHQIEPISRTYCPRMRYGIRSNSDQIC